MEPAFHACARCPVRAECKELGRKEHGGIWGGVWKGKMARCPKCKDRFVPSVGRRVICSKCAGVDSFEQPDAVVIETFVHGVCRQCGAEYEPKAPNSRYCSRQCQKRFRQPLWWHGMKTNCPSCGVEFEMKREHHRYCSDMCRKRFEVAESKKTLATS